MSILHNVIRSIQYWIEHKVAKIVKEEDIDEFVMGNVVIMFLLYVDDEVIFGNALGDVQQLMRVL